MNLEYMELIGIALAIFFSTELLYRYQAVSGFFFFA